jgi:hypothetical protein
MRQSVVQLLSSEGGLKKLKELLDEIPFDTYAPPLKRQVFVGSILPFLQILTNPDVSKSSLLETDVDRLYTVLWGNETGGRALRLFRFITGISETLTMDQLEPSVAAFAGLLDKKGKAAVTEGFDTTLQAFQEALRNVQDDRGDLTSLRTKQLLEHAEKRLGFDQTLSDATATALGPTVQPSFKLKHDAPGKRKP